MNSSDLKSGDCLIFSRKGIFDTLIKIKTWSKATHVEVFIGNGHTVASRNGKGVSIYDLDLSGLYCVLRPKWPFNLDKAYAGFILNHQGKPYGWLSLLSFCLIDLHDNGEFCSEFATNFYRDGGFEPFRSDIKAETVAPADFLYVNESVMETVWRA